MFDHSCFKQIRVAVVLCVLGTTGCHQISLLNADTAAPDPSSAGTASTDSSTPQEQMLRKPGPFASDDLSDRESADACLATARELESHGFDQQAIHAYERTLSFDAKRRGLSHPLARLHASTGNAQQATLYFQKAIAERPGDAAILGDYGYFLFEQHDLVNAEQHLREALRIDPANVRNNTNLALVLFAAERIDESLSEFEKSVGRAAARFNVAMLLARAGKRERAREFVREALLLDPQLPQARAFAEWLDREPPAIQ